MKFLLREIKQVLGDLVVDPGFIKYASNQFQKWHLKVQKCSNSEMFRSMPFFSSMLILFVKEKFTDDRSIRVHSETEELKGRVVILGTHQPGNVYNI